MTLQPGKQTTVTNILSNISRSIGSQTMRTFFKKNNIQNVAKKLFPDPFLKKEN